MCMYGTLERYLYTYGEGRRSPSMVDRRHRHAVAEHAGAAVAAAVPGRLLGIDRALNSGRHRRRLGADVPRVITIILSRRPIVLSTFLSSGFITLFNLSTRASSPPPAAQKLAKGVHVPGLYRRWARGVPAPDFWLLRLRRLVG